MLRTGFGLPLTIALTATSAIAGSQSHRYVNGKYGFAFALPSGATVCRSTPPQPDYGLLFRPRGVTSPPCTGDIEAGDRYTSVNARFDEDGADVPANFVSKACREFAYDSQGKVTAITPPVTLKGVLTWAGCRIDGADTSIQEIYFARRNGTAVTPPIDYTLALKTTSRSYRVDHLAFQDWLKTVRLTGVSIEAMVDTKPLPASYEVGEPARTMPAVGSCVSTRIREVTSRLVDIPESGTTILSVDGHAQVSYDRIPAAERSRSQDAVTLCVVSVPKDCPAGDYRGVVYRAKDHRTRRIWNAPDAEHGCGRG